VADVLGALSLTTDLGSGLPFEKGLRTCAVASAFAEALDLGLADRRAVFHAALLRAIGCTAHAPENAAMFLDDVMFQRAFKVLDPADPEAFASRFGDWAGARQPELLALVIEKTPTVGVYAARSGCEVSQALGARLGISSGAIAALDQVYERWDGRGIPDGVSGEELTLAAHVAEQAVIAHAEAGEAGARRELARRGRTSRPEPVRRVRRARRHAVRGAQRRGHARRGPGRRTTPCREGGRCEPRRVVPRAGDLHRSEGCSSGRALNPCRRARRRSRSTARDG
jgi:HD domain